MRKVILLILGFFCFINLHVFADSNYQNDYTLIDCENGSDSSGTPFDSTKPYKTLNEGIEKTINYINTYVNTGSLTTQSGITFNIKVNCTLMRLGTTQTSLNFDGYTYKNFLKIEGVGDNGLSIKDITFDIPPLKGNIIFENAKFLSNSIGYYFTSPGVYYTIYMNFGVKIENSYIKLLPGTEIGQTNITYTRSRGGSYGTYHYNPFQYIKNSTIDVEISGNYNFYTPIIVKDSKINFINNYSTGIYDIKFSEVGSVLYGYDFDFFNLMSNEIDMGGNNFTTENTRNASFINNKFSNFNNFYLGQNDVNLKYGIFINNLIENTNTIDISKNRNIINNVFSGDYTDTYDIRNLRKNYRLDNLGTKGIGWVFQKLHASDMFRLNYSSTSLYKEITGQDVPSLANTVYAIFSR
ncbi:MAG: hypothetical protein WC850_06090 [Candidatus Gracilibacteria bacterium]